jgi:hypothetical protein
MGSPTGTKGKLLGRTALVACTMLVCILVMELALRIVSPLQRFANPLHAFHDPDPNVGWRGRPDVHARFATADFDCEVRHDARGLRAHESPAPSVDSPVWLFLGDSFTWGWGVGQGEPFTDLLQATLGPAVLIENRGLSGSGTVQQMLMLRQRLAQGPKPEKVIVVFCPNDFTDCVQPRTDRPFMVRKGDQMALTNCPVEGGGLQSGIGRAISSQSRLASTIRFAVNRTKSRVRHGSKGSAPRPLTADEVDSVHQCLSDMLASCQESEAELTVVYTSMPEDMLRGEDSERRVALRKICHDLGIPLVDPTDPMRTRSDSGPDALFFAQDHHWSRDGHKVVAEVIAQSLLSP